jgi:hypothetical protein
MEVSLDGSAGVVRANLEGLRKAHDEFTAPAGALAEGTHAASMHLDELSDQSQSESKAPSRVIDGLRGLPERLEDVREFLRCEADPRVVHAQHKVVARARADQLDQAMGGTLEIKQFRIGATTSAGLESNPPLAQDVVIVTWNRRRPYRAKASNKVAG